ncbi:MULTISPECIES: DUF4333 domain-containing protein [Streptomyces]|uniref:DUF4333 domain-containing protein n=1 Tax=Streptomyces TaxID=1883 RepID=UPI000B9EE6C1|nr:DUF4333 domain-containing protein [Streptomyces kasugaensis]
MSTGVSPVRLWRAVAIGMATALLVTGVVVYAAARLMPREATGVVDGGTHTIPRAEIARTVSGQLSLPLRNGPDRVRCAGDLRPVPYTVVRCTAHFPTGLERQLTVEVIHVRHNKVTYRRLTERR